MTQEQLRKANELQREINRLEEHMREKEDICDRIDNKDRQEWFFCDLIDRDEYMNRLKGRIGKLALELGAL